MSRAIMVIAANLTPFAKQCLLDLMPKLHIEQFTENELLVNITGGCEACWCVAARVWVRGEWMHMSASWIPLL